MVVLFYLVQLIEGIPNQEKSSKDFQTWMEATYKSKTARREYMERHLIPDVELSLENFKEFIEKREALLIERLYDELVIRE